MRQITLLNMLGSAGKVLLAALHKPWAEVWLWYRQMMAAGWFEAIDCQTIEQSKAAGCPVVGLIEKSNLTHKKESSV